MKYTNYQKFVHMKVVGQSLFFYLREGNSQTYLFTQKSYTGVREFFKRDISIPQLLNRHKWGRDRMVDHVVRKLPRYISYAEQYAA